MEVFFHERASGAVNDGKESCYSNFPLRFNWRAYLEWPSVSARLPRCRSLLAGISQGCEATESLVEALLISCCNCDPVIKADDWPVVGILFQHPRIASLPRTAFGPSTMRELGKRMEILWCSSFPPFHFSPCYRMIRFLRVSEYPFLYLG